LVAARLTPDPLRWEATAFQTARWRAMSKSDQWYPRGFEVRCTQGGQRRLPQALVLIQDKTIAGNARSLHPAEIRGARSRLETVSNCAASCIHLWKTTHTCQSNGETEKLIDEERRWAGRLTPMGIEIQIPRVCIDEHIAWQEFFRSHNIQTPRRPECGSLFELALPPSASWHAPSEITALVLSLNFADANQDIGIHVSLQGDLGDAAGDLAFTQLFLNQSVSKQPRERAALRHVMSKGMVYRNPDVVRCAWSSPADCRTEIRVMIVPVKEKGTFVKSHNQITQSLKELQLLGSAAVSKESGARKLLCEFRNLLRKRLRDYPPCVMEFLESDFYQATGDYRAASLTETMQILDRRDRLREIPAEAARQLSLEIGHLRTACADHLIHFWN
jgi:hypothetical protein